MLKRTLSKTLAAVLLSLPALTACTSQLHAHGTIVDMPAPEVRLNRFNHAPFLMSEEQGKEVVLFFGYTHCGDVCPTTLAHVAQALKEARTPAHAIDVVFITVDPKRDTPAVTARYARIFDPTFIGLSGPAQELAQIERAYHVWAKALPPDKHGEYEVSHSSELLLIAPNGRVRIIEDWDTSVHDLAEDLRAL